MAASACNPPYLQDLWDLVDQEAQFQLWAWLGHSSMAAEGAAWGDQVSERAIPARVVLVVLAVVAVVVAVLVPLVALVALVALVVLAPDLEAVKPRTSSVEALLTDLAVELVEVVVLALR